MGALHLVYSLSSTDPLDLLGAGVLFGLLISIELSRASSSVNVICSVTDSFVFLSFMGANPLDLLGAGDLLHTLILTRNPYPLSSINVEVSATNVLVSLTVLSSLLCHQ